MVTAVCAAACSGIVGETPVVSLDPGTTATSAPRNTTTEGGPCVRFTPGGPGIDTGSVAGDALALSGEMFLCADDVVIVAESDIGQLAIAAQLAAALDGPLLFPEPRLAAELGRLKPKRVHTLGSFEINTPNASERIEHDLTSAVEATLTALGVEATVDLGAGTPTEAVVESVKAIRDGDRVAAPASNSVTSSSAATSTTTTVAVAAEIDAGALVRALATPTDAESIWVVDTSSPQRILLASAFGSTVGAAVLAVEWSNLLDYPELSSFLREHPAETRRTIGAQVEASQWELNVLERGEELPGGGFRILPADGLRRYVAYYGHPSTDALGALGEQGPAETLQVMQPFLDAYADDGAQVVPAFEIIASVASGGADDGDYSYEWPLDTFSEWIAFAEANGVYVVLDLQPGRDDFLSQAVQYEELLKLPFVGLALDPEWRLAPDQVHLEQVGRVDASEVNTVLEWLGDLVRDNGLPQKMVVLHQFRTSMIQNRQEVIQRPELQVVVQMDGDGTEPQKDATWAALKEGAEEAHWAWGWKNFFDEDEPGPPSPESTMSKEPTPVYVSYQ